MLRIAIAIVGLAATACTGALRAEDWPVRPVTLVVPFAAGGPVDTIARIMVARISELLGQQMVIENVGDASGLTGANRVAKAAPDGYTVLLSGSAGLTQNPQTQKNPPYNGATDFAHVALFSDSARVLIARKDLPANNFAEFRSYAKENQNKMQYGSAGAGSGSHIRAILLDEAIFSFPKGTPQAIVQRLAKASSDAIDTPAMRERFKGIGVVVTAPERRSPEYLSKFVVSETERWYEPLNAAGMIPQ